MIGHFVQQNPDHPSGGAAQLLNLGLAQLLESGGQRFLNDVVKVGPAEELAALRKATESADEIKRRIAEEVARAKFEVESNGPQTESLSAWLQEQKKSGGAKLPSRFCRS